MRAIEINSKTDNQGQLKIDYQLNESDKQVRVLILLEDDSSDQGEETQWLSSLSKNPAFDFLHDEGEDVYSINDGKPFND